MRNLVEVGGVKLLKIIILKTIKLLYKISLKVQHFKFTSSSQI